MTFNEFALFDIALFQQRTIQVNNSVMCPTKHLSGIKFGLNLIRSLVTSNIVYLFTVKLVYDSYAISNQIRPTW